jgi:hypothetical protein
MGANAVTTVYDFTAGQVLTAAQMDNVNCGIPVFATTTTRDAAFGGTGEKTLAEGQFAYIEASNTTQYYDGAAWQPVGTTPGLVYLTGASFSAVASVSAPNSTFTSSYKNFKVILQVTSASTTAEILFRFRASGTDDSNNMYRQTSAILTSTNADSNITGDRTSFRLGSSTSASNAICFTSFDINDMADSTVTKGVIGVTTFENGVNHMGGNFVGQLNTDKAFDSISFLTSTGTMTGNYRIYAYSES